MGNWISRTALCLGWLCLLSACPGEMRWYPDMEPSQAGPDAGQGASVVLEFGGGLEQGVGKDGGATGDGLAKVDSASPADATSSVINLVIY